MKIKALTSFSGALTMHKDEVIEYDNRVVLDDLLQAGYIVEVKDTPKRGVKKIENK